MRRALVFSLVALLFGIGSDAVANTLDDNTAAATTLTERHVNGNQGFSLNEQGWRYRPGDDMSWSAVDLDDRSWQVIQTTTAVPNSSWHGLGWFRLHLRVSSELANRPLAMGITHWGASEIYLDGQLLHRFGRVGTYETEDPFNPNGASGAMPTPISMVLGIDREHVLAVRVSNAAVRSATQGWGRWLLRLPGAAAGFTSIVGLAPVLAARQEESRGRLSVVMPSLATLFAAFALLHAFLFAAYPRDRANLFFSLYALALSAALWEDWRRAVGHGGLWIHAAAWTVAQVMAAVGAVAFLLFLYAALGVRRSWFLAAFATASAAGLAWRVWAPDSAGADALAAILTLVWIAGGIHVVVAAVRSSTEGASVVGAAVLMAAVPFLNDALLTFGVRSPARLRITTNFFALSAVILCVSFYLARRFARTSTDLHAQLARVIDLSARDLEHERRLAALQVQQEREHAEHARIAQELERARRLQLSMVPQSLPAVPHLEVAALMSTANEVGGDYYDFHVADDGTLTVGFGDATGHGLAAGILVTAMKSLFMSDAGRSDIATTMAHWSCVFDRMALPAMFMAFAVVRVRGMAVTCAVAGLPPALIYRAASASVEAVPTAGVPLGMIVPYQYEIQDLRLHRGDVVLLMTDGFPERFNLSDDMLGYDAAEKLLAEVGHRSAEEIISRFVDVAAAWAEGRPLTDDMTFVVVRVKDDVSSLAPPA